MPLLYKLAAEFAALYDIDPDDPECGIPEEALIDTLEAMEMGLNDKLINTGRLVKSLKGEVEAIRAEEQRLARRRRAMERRIESITAYAMDAMVATGKTTVDDATCKLVIRNNPESVRIVDFEALREDPRTPWKPEKFDEDRLAKTELKAMLQAGEVFDGAELQRTKRLAIA